MPAALPFTDRVSQSSTRTRTTRTIRCQFGDGYEQVRPDGINYYVDEWTVGYEAINQAERSTLIAFLESIGAWDYCTWTPPGEASAKKFRVVGDWTERPQSGDLYSIGFTLRQYF